MMISEEILHRTILRCRERNIIIPTYEEMSQPEKIPDRFKKELESVGLGDVHPRNLFRITWKNEPVSFGGGFGPVNKLEMPRDLTGIKARIIMLLGCFFPTGSHKVGATFGPLVEKLVKGEFDPTSQKALWPSTGNYCRGGTYDAALLACPSIAVLPEEMSEERFLWLERMGAEVYRTAGSESNVKEVFDKTELLKKMRPDEIVVLNQFSEFGNAVWHYACTGRAFEEVIQNEIAGGSRLSALFLTQGSAGTLASGDYLKEKFPHIKVCAGEALQCPTMLYNGYGAHQIEGIGDKHIPWIFNVRNLDAAAAIDDRQCLRLMRLFNELEGQSYLLEMGISEDLVSKLPLLGLSGIANLIGSIKIARYFEMGEKDVVMSLSTDSMDLYGSRIVEQNSISGPYNRVQAAADLSSCLYGQSIDFVEELGYWDKKRIHNLKYFTWVEQRGMDDKELTRQWEDDSYWTEKFRSHVYWDDIIREFNRKSGLL